MCCHFTKGFLKDIVMVITEQYIHHTKLQYPARKCTNFSDAKVHNPVQLMVPHVVHKLANRGNSAFVSGCTFTHGHNKRVIKKKTKCRVCNRQLFFSTSHCTLILSLLKSVIPANHQHPKLKQTLSSNLPLVTYTIQQAVSYTVHCWGLAYENLLSWRIFCSTQIFLPLNWSECVINVRILYIQ